MAKLTNDTIEKLKDAKKISTLSEKQSFSIFIATSDRMTKYTRDYSKKEKASHIAASKVLLTS